MGSTSGSGLTGTVLQAKPASIWQVDEQPSPLMVLPSSHCLVSPGNSRPLPQAVAHGPPAGGQVGSSRQNGEQPSPVVVLPSSHCSEPCLTPSPHMVVVHTVGPAQPLASLALVQDQPSASVGGLLSSVQRGLQPSPAVAFPSSHCSLPATMP